jgi:hypothetical protein
MEPLYITRCSERRSNMSSLIYTETFCRFCSVITLDVGACEDLETFDRR